MPRRDGSSAPAEGTFAFISAFTKLIALRRARFTDALTHVGSCGVYSHPMITSSSLVAHSGRNLPVRLLGLALAVSALVSCSTSPTGAKGSASTPIVVANAADDAWANNCYAKFERDVLKLSGERALNCGLLRIDATEAQRAEVEQCARDAEASKRPYRAGQIGIDIADTYIACDVAIRDPSGQRWRLWYDFDLGDKLSHGKSDGVVAVSRCSSIAFRPGTLLSNSFFELNGCQEAPMTVASPVLSGAP